MTPTISVLPASSTSAHETSVTTRDPEVSAKRAFQPGADAIEVIFRATDRHYGKAAAAIRLANASPARIGMLPMGPASLVMERKMLLGVKARAERLAIHSIGSAK